MVARLNYMQPRSAIAKGKQLEKAIERDLRQSGIDIYARRNIGSGSGLAKGDIYSPKYGLSIECKNTKTIGMNAWRQALKDSEKGNATPMLIWKPPYADIDNCLVVVEWWWLKQILKQLNPTDK